MPLIYPAGVNKHYEKMRYIFRVREHARLIHNAIGLWMREGLSSDQLANGIDCALLGGIKFQIIKMPNSVRTSFSDKSQLTKTEYDQAITSKWKPIFIMIEDEYNVIRNQIRNDPNYDGDIDFDSV